MPLIDRPYFIQINNKFNPRGSCFPTSMACMLYPFIKNNNTHGLALDDYIWWKCNRGIGKQYALSRNDANWLKSKGFFKHERLNTIWDVEFYVANQIQNDVNCEWRENGDVELIKSRIDNNSPVLIHIKNWSGGHIVTILGYNDEGFIMNDSWGNALKGYSDHWGDGGDKVIYPYEWLLPQLYGNPIRMGYYYE